MRDSRRLVSMFLFLTLLFTGLSTIAAHEPETSPSDVRLTFKLVGVSPEGEQMVRTYQMVVSRSRHPAHITQGFLVPIPTTTFNTQASESGTIAPVTSFTYQNVGFTANAEVTMIEGGRVHLKAQVEDSSIAGKESQGGHPMISTVNQALEVKLKDGESTRVGRVENSEFGSMFLEITAEILD